MFTLIVKVNVTSLQNTNEYMTIGGGIVGETKPRDEIRVERVDVEWIRPTNKKKQTDYQQ
jgi:hypothetical protein